MKKIYIFGTNALSLLLYYYLCDEGKQIDGFVLNSEYLSESVYEGINVYSIEEMISLYGSENISVYISVAYSNMNNTREVIFNWIKKQGISILSYYHPTVIMANNADLGEGNIILENSIVQPFVRIGNGNILWENVSVSHHCYVGSFNYFAPSSTIAGKVMIGNKCFFGANTTTKNNIRIANEVLIGAGAYVNCDLNDSDVLVPPRSVLLEKKSKDIILI